MRRNRWFVLVLLLVSVAFSGVVAEDAGATTPLPLPSESPACGATVTHSFRLSGNKTCASGSWIVINGEDITVDLGGNTVTGAAGFTGVGISGSGITLRNGRIDGFGIGVSASGSKNVVEEIWATNSGFEAFVLGGSGNTYIGNIAEDSTIGFLMTGEKVKIVRNLASDNSGDGFAQSGSALTGTIASNTAFENGGNGFTLRGTVVVSRNFALANDDDGFDFGQDPAKIIGNVAVANDNGFDITSSESGWSLVDNVALANSHGIESNATPSPKGKGNIATGNNVECNPASVCTHSADSALPLMQPSCGQLITESFRLQGDMSCTNSHGIVAAADKITVDLNGHSVMNTGGGPWSGVQINGHQGVIVRHGAIRNFATGALTTQSSAKNVLEGLVVSGADVGFSVLGAGNSVRGGWVQGARVGFDTGSSSATTFSRNVANDFTEDGFHQRTPAAGFVLDTNFAGAADTFADTNHGFQIDGAEKVVVQRNVAFLGASHGFFFGGAAPGKVIGNAAFENGGDGFRLNSPAEGWVLTDNASIRNGFLGGVDDNLGTGFQLFSTPAPKAKGNIAALNDDWTNCSPQMVC